MASAPRVATVIVALTLAACGSSVASPSPSATVAPTPVITPDPHLTAPATADAVFNAIRKAGLPLSVTNASSDPKLAIVKRINAAIDNWPLIITQYKSSELLRPSAKWDPTKPLDDASPAYVFVGLNIMVAFGPASGTVAVPDSNRQEQAQRLVDVLDPLLWPLEQRSITPIATKTPAPASTPAPSAAAKPSAKPSVKP
jgi:hypothetical protein